MEVIDREDKVIVVDDKDNSVVINVDKQDMLVYSPDIPKKMYKYAADKTDYESSLDSEDYVDWPIEFESTHHLEDSLWSPALNAIEEECNREFAEDIFESSMNGSIDPEQISVTEKWSLESDGSVRLKKVIYNGKEYTVNTRPMHDHM